MGSYIVLGLAESLLRPRTAPAQKLPPSIRAELEADEALEPDDDDDLEAKAEGDEYI